MLPNYSLESGLSTRRLRWVASKSGRRLLTTRLLRSNYLQYPYLCFTFQACHSPLHLYMVNIWKWRLSSQSRMWFRNHLVTWWDALQLRRLKVSKNIKLGLYDMCPENTVVVFNVFQDGSEEDTEIQGGEKVSGLLYNQRRRLYELKTKKAVKIREWHCMFPLLGQRFCNIARSENFLLIAMWTRFNQ